MERDVLNGEEGKTVPSFKSGGEVDSHPGNLPRSSDEASQRLANLLENNPQILGKPLLVIGRIDHPTKDLTAILLGIDASGDSVIAGLTGRPASQDVIDHLLEYTDSVRLKDYTALNDLAGPYLEEKNKEVTALSALHKIHFGLDEEIKKREFNRTQRVILVAPEYPESVKGTLGWISITRADITALQFEYYRSSTGEEALRIEKALPSAKRGGMVADTVVRSLKKLWEPVVPGKEELPKWMSLVQERLQGLLAFFTERGISESILAYSLLFLPMLGYLLTFGWLSVRDHNAFGTWAFDLGIYDQGLWLLSQGKMAFVTVRGLHIFGDHTPLILLLFVPFYWLWSDVKVLLILQTVALALGAIPIYWLARDKFENRWISLIFPLVYLLYPALQWSNWEDFHPDTLATPLMLFAFYFLTRKKFIPLALLSFLVLLIKEDMALTVFALGIYIFFKHNRKVGLATSLVSLIWFLFLINILVPYFNPLGSPHLEKFAHLGSTWTEVVASPLLKPGLVISTMASQERMLYLFQLLVSVIFLPLLSLSTLAISFPALGSNLLSGHAYQHLIQYHYTVLITPFVFISLIYASAKVMRTTYSKYLTVVLLLLASLLSNIYFSPSPISRKFNVGGYWGIPTARHKVVRQAMSLIPRNASVSAYYAFVPHLTHREKIYMFPNPFRDEYWGIRGENTHNPEGVEYIFVDTTLLSGETLGLANSLVQNPTYSKVFDQEGIVLLKRKDVRNVE